MCAAIFVLVFTIPLLAGAILLRQSGVLSFRRWAVPVLLAGFAISFPAVVFYSWLRPVLEPHIVSRDPALWIEDLSCDIMDVMSFFWFVALVVVVLLKGVTFKNRKSKWLVTAAVVVVMFPASVINCFWVQFSSEHPMDATMANAASPDGRWCAYCVNAAWLEHTAGFAYERNQWFHVSRRYGASTDVTFLVSPFFAGYRVVWSRDSQVASVWVGDQAILAEQIDGGEEAIRGAGHSEAGGMSVETRLAKQSECTAKVRALLDAHGGAAP